MNTNKSRRKFVMTIMSFLLFFSFLKAQDLSDETRKEIDKLNQRMVELTLDGKYLSLVDFYADDAIVEPDFMPKIVGKDAIKKIYAEELKSKVKYHSFNGTIDEIWQCGNMIYERGTFGMSFSEEKNPKPRAFYGAYFQIWIIKDDGSYKIKYSIWNLDFNP